MKLFFCIKDGLQNRTFARAEECSMRMRSPASVESSHGCRRCSLLAARLECRRYSQSRRWFRRWSLVWKDSPASREDIYRGKPEVHPALLYTLPLTGSYMDFLTIKTPNPKWRLYWFLIEFLDWRFSQSCWHFWLPLWTIAPLSFSLVSSPPLSLCE